MESLSDCAMTNTSFPYFAEFGVGVVGNDGFVRVKVKLSSMIVTSIPPPFPPLSDDDGAKHPENVQSEIVVVLPIINTEFIAPPPF